MLPPELLAAQNPDGGWPYRAGSSWTEPTAYMLLAMGESHPADAARDRALAWLCQQQRADGGWSPHAEVDHSTWVTALVLLLPSAWVEEARLQRAAQWLLSQTGQESTWLFRLRQRLLGTEVPDSADPGWPWFPGTAAWVAPTALTLLALRRFERRRPSPAIRARLEQGRHFLLSRMCADGGWNHGAARALGYNGNSYPETTGMALLALQGTDAARLSRSLAAAEQHLRSCRSAEAASWLRMGLWAHARAPAAVSAPPRNLRDTVLLLLSEQALRGKNVFLD